jgi:Family of unknown function (DUF5361)
VGRVCRNRVAGIAGLGDILKEHWGAVGHDLLCAGYTWDDIGSERLPVGQFASFVAYAPPGTALFHQRNKGWTTGDYLTAQSVDALSYLAWAKTKDAHSKSPKHRPEPIPRPVFPGQQEQKPQKAADKPFTVEDYVRLSGLNMDLEGR